MKYDQYRGLYTNGGYHPVEQLTMFKRAPQVEIGPGVHLSHRREPRPLSRTTASAQPRRGIDFYICISYTFTSVFLKLWLLYFFNFYICISKTYLFLFRNTSLDDGVRLDYLMSITLSLLSFFHFVPVHMRCRKWYSHTCIIAFLAKPPSLLGIGLLTWQLGEKRGVEGHK